MGEYKLGMIEARFADMIWEHEPISTAQLVKLCEQEFHWKRTTTYTVLKRLAGKGIFQNVDGTVSSLVSREEFYAVQSTQFVEETFQGSLPAFLAAFSTKKTLSQEEIAEIRKMIDSYGEV